MNYLSATLCDFANQARISEFLGILRAMEKLNQISRFRTILKSFPQNIKFCFAYGSGAMKQVTDPSTNMLDLIFVVRNSSQWHMENLRRNPSHYSGLMRILGHKAVTKLQEHSGAGIYFNTLVKTAEGRTVKYGVVSEVSLVEDLLDWNFLYLAGRLHKPVEVLLEPDENSQLQTALVQNLHSAIHATLLLLPEHFTEIDFYKVITGLSYNGDFRMIFGEDKDKVHNIVVPQDSKDQTSSHCMQSGYKPTGTNSSFESIASNSSSKISTILDRGSKIKGYRRLFTSNCL
ncbi:phosphatidate cytidylyltransferase, mitochondrial [Orussus abietinus]|uniref:phosphatidate cytidylyltransferase, mitochondrial n=1 Tax=Orussus abietinus TaxID=222816 RepID=UPI000626B876|nr:phosphatidate cytidylyltransferase, mitochondrial [Orussus abietinus]